MLMMRFVAIEDRCVRRYCTATKHFAAGDGHYFVQKYKLPRTISILRTLFPTALPLIIRK